MIVVCRNLRFLNNFPEISSKRSTSWNKFINVNTWSNATSANTPDPLSLVTESQSLPHVCIKVVRGFIWTWSRLNMKCSVGPCGTRPPASCLLAMTAAVLLSLRRTFHDDRRLLAQGAGWCRVQVQGAGMTAGDLLSPCRMTQLHGPPRLQPPSTRGRRRRGRRPVVCGLWSEPELCW